MRLLRLCSAALLLAWPAAAQVQCQGIFCWGTAAEINGIASPHQNTIAVVTDAFQGKECPPVGGGTEPAVCIYLSGTWVPLFSDVQGDPAEPTNIETVDEHAAPSAPITEAHSLWFIDRATGELCYTRQVDGSTRCTGRDQPRSYEPFVCDDTQYGARYFDSDDGVGCFCANDGTDDGWLMANMPVVHATSHCTSDPPALLSANLIARYDPWFQPGTQTLYDMSGNEENATLGSTAGTDANDPAWSAYSVEFDAAEDFYVTTPELGSAIESIDVLLYVPTTIRDFTNPQQYVLSASGSVSIELANVQCGGCADEVVSVRAGAWSVWEDDGVGLTAGWHLLQFNWNDGASNWEIYVDGSEKVTTVVTFGGPGGTVTSWAADKTYEIGGEGPLGSGAFGGRVGWLDLFSAARSDGDLEQNAQAIIAQRPGLNITPYVFEALE